MRLLYETVLLKSTVTFGISHKHLQLSRDTSAKHFTALET